MSVFPPRLPRSLIINSAAIFGGEAVARCATLFMAVVIARKFGPTALGEYGYALALASVILLVPDFGMHLFAVREISIDARCLPRIFWNIHWLKFLLTGAIALCVAFASAWVIPDAERRILFYFLAARAILQTYSQASMAVFKAFERMHYIAFQQSLNSLVLMLWVTAALTLRTDLWTLVSALIAGQAAETFLGWHILRSRFSLGVLAKWNGKLISAVAVASIPIGITTMLQALNLRIDILVLGRFVPNQVLGQFQAVSWLPVGTFLLTSLMMGVLFPKLSRLLSGDSMQGAAYVKGLLKNGLLVTASGSLVLWFAAPILLIGIFGKSLAPAIPTLRLMTPMLPLVFLNTTLFYVFVAARRRAVYLSTLGVGVALGLGLSSFLTAHYGVTGCALADVAREFTMTDVYLFFLVQQNHARAAGRALLRVFIPTTLLAGLVELADFSSRLDSRWCAVWMVLVLSETLLVFGFPRLSEWRFLADERL
jgi:O-antigen/teichoic acid export membrane protein